MGRVFHLALSHGQATLLKDGRALVLVDGNLVLDLRALEVIRQYMYTFSFLPRRQAATPAPRVGSPRLKQALCLWGIIRLTV